jgi:hypothetical protein
MKREQTASPRATPDESPKGEAVGKQILVI